MRVDVGIVKKYGRTFFRRSLFIIIQTKSTHLYLTWNVELRKTMTDLRIVKSFFIGVMRRNYGSQCDRTDAAMKHMGTISLFFKPFH